MTDQGRLSIWKGDPALDSWYNAAINRNASFHNVDKSDMEEMLFSDIAKSNQVKYPSGSANDWFYRSTTGDAPIVESVFTCGETCVASANLPQLQNFMLSKQMGLRLR